MAMEVLTQAVHARYLRPLSPSRQWLTTEINNDSNCNQNHCEVQTRQVFTYRFTNAQTCQVAKWHDCGVDPGRWETVPSKVSTTTACLALAVNLRFTPVSASLLARLVYYDSMYRPPVHYR